MTPKINITELMADREAGTGGKWTIDKCPCNHRSCSYYGTSNGSFDQGNGYTLEDARRIARLPALEAAYIEAVGLLDQAEDAINEMFRYYDGGESRGSYDRKPERAQLRKAGYALKAFLAKP